MNKFLTKIIGASLAFAMMIGAGVGINAAKEAKEVNAATSWTPHTGAITAGSEYLIVKVDGNYSMNPKNSTASGNTTANAGDYEQVAFSAQSGPDRGFIFEDAGNSKFYIKDGTCFVRANGTTNNGLASATSNNTNPNYGIWTVTETNTAGQYTIINNNDRQISAYQSSNWRSYGNTSGSKTNVKIYEKAAVKTLSSIAVQTAPTKTTYYAGEHFDPTGLVITRTYSDSTSDTYTYANHVSDFTFTPNTSAELTTDNTSVTIGYGGKTTTQAITVNAARTMSSIELHGTIAKTEYYVGDTWDLDGLNIQVNWSEGNPTFVDLDDENVLYECSPATAENTSLTSFNIRVLYENFDETFPVNGLTVAERPLADVLDKTTIPAAAIGSTSSAWGAWTEVTDYTYSLSTTNGAKYKAKLMGPSSNDYVGRMNDSINGGFYTSQAPVGVRIKTIAFSSMAASKNVSVFLQNEAYASMPSTVDNVKATLTSTNLSYSVEGNYSCFALRGRSSSLDVGALTIEYEEINPSMSASPSSITLSSNGTQNVEITVENYTLKPTLECEVQSGASSIASATVGAVNNEYKATATITATSVSGNAVVRVRDTANPSAYYVDINVTVQSAKDVIEGTITTSTSLAYRYNKSGATVDRLDKDFINLEDDNYANWTGKTGSSGAIYAGNTYGPASNIQLRSNNSNSGIVTTSSGGFAKKVTIVWNNGTQSGRTLDVYGKNSAYEAATDLYDNATKGTKIGSIVCGTSTTLTINNDYEFIGLRSNNGGMNIESIDIQWGEYTYTYSDISMRFGGSINEDLWDELDTNEHVITGVGVMITSYEEQLRTPYSIKEHAAEAIPSNQEHNINTQIVDFYAPLSTFDIPKQNNNYYWNLRYEIASSSEEDIIDSYTAAAYIKLTNGELVFLKQVRYSVWSLANDYLNNRECDQETAGGSLYALAHSVQMS